MEKLVIHQPSNHYSKRFRYYNIFFDNLINEISKIHDVVVDRYRKRTHMGRTITELELIDDEFYGNIEMLECEMIIENITKNEIIIFSVSDDLTPAILNICHLPQVKKIYVSQFIREKINQHINLEYEDKFSPWIYFPSTEIDLDYYYNLRKEKENFIDKMYFRGSTSYRPILNFLSEDNFFGGDSIGQFDSYAKEMINYSTSLSLAGRGEFCYRDIECMAIGIPLIRFNYLSEMKEKLIPDYHYISVNRPDSLQGWLKLDREGGSSEAELIEVKFNLIKKDKEFLKFVSKNAKDYYEKFLSPKNIVNYTMQLLEL